MKRMIFFNVCLFFALTSLFIAKEGDGKAGTDKKKIIYQAMWNSDNITGEIYINGFLITDFNGSQSAGTSPLNAFLIGKNEIRAQARKADESKSAHLSFGVSELAQGDIAATNEHGNLLSIEITNNDFTATRNVKTSKKFNSTLDFSRHLLGTGTANEKEVIEYAKKIYGLFKAKNAEAIQKEFAVKINDYAEAFSSSTFAAEFKSYLTEDLLKGKLLTIDPRALQAKKSGPDNNLWHILEGDKELIRTVSADGATSELGIYIGIVDGRLRVVR